MTDSTALLVIHGIGEQNPYEMLDHSVRGLVRYFRGQGHVPTLRPERIRHEDWTEVAVHLDFQEPASPRGLRRLTLCEFYWALYAEGKVAYRGVIAWLVRTAADGMRGGARHVRTRIGSSDGYTALLLYGCSP